MYYEALGKHYGFDPSAPFNELSDDVKKRANVKISFGRITLPHQLIRVVLLEQIYRSFKIINNETYHK